MLPYGLNTQSSIYHHSKHIIMYAVLHTSDFGTIGCAHPTLSVLVGRDFSSTSSPMFVLIGVVVAREGVGIMVVEIIAG